MQEITTSTDIKSKIYTLRDKQVMLDRDLAELYGVKNIRLREQVKRNIDRFPHDFMFQLEDNEVDFMVSQNAIPSKKHLGGSNPYVFTEQGVASISGVLTNKIAIEINIKIMRAFVSMRKFISQNAPLFQRVEALEQNQLITNTNIDKIFKALEDKTQIQKQGIFYNGQIFDAHSFVSKLIRSAKESIVLIDNYIDESTLTLLSKNQKVNITIYTHTISNTLKQDIQKYNKQYKPLHVNTTKDFHDRFLILDDKEIYHIGASLKDLGKKVFGFSKMEDISCADIVPKENK